MARTIKEYIIYFMAYSIVGWIYEVFLEVFVYRVGFSNRGALFGPYCVVYGFGAIIILGLLRNLSSQRIDICQINIMPLIIFLGIIFITTTVELISSYIMEFTAGGWLWDYSGNMLNFQGRIALNPSVRFGIGGMVIIYILQPFFESIAKKISENAISIICAALCIAVFTDSIFYIIKLIKN